MRGGDGNKLLHNCPVQGKAARYARGIIRGRATPAWTIEITGWEVRGVAVATRPGRPGSLCDRAIMRSKISDESRNSQGVQNRIFKVRERAGWEDCTEVRAWVTHAVGVVNLFKRLFFFVRGQRKIELGRG